MTPPRPLKKREGLKTEFSHVNSGSVNHSYVLKLKWKYWTKLRWTLLGGNTYIVICYCAGKVTCPDSSGKGQLKYCVWKPPRPYPSDLSLWLDVICILCCNKTILISDIDYKGILDHLHFWPARYQFRDSHFLSPPSIL